MKLLSIIIPVYNLEKYIERCLESVYKQALDEYLYEVIAVDDGSKDNSLPILKSYAEKHGNMRVIHQENAGVSVARNNAINVANGQYLTFVDGDDELIEGSLNKVIDYLKKYSKIDLVYCNIFTYRNNDLESYAKKIIEYNKVYSGEDLLHSHYINNGSVCAAFYNTDFLRYNNLWFGEGLVNCEDTIFVYLLYANKPSIIFSDIDLYKINIREGSATHSVSLKRVNSFENNVKYLQEYRSTHKLSILQMEALDMSMYHTISQAVNMYLKLNANNWKYIYERLDIKNIWQLRVTWAPMHQKIKIFILNISFYVYYNFIKINKNLSLWKQK